jgi:uncharacterized protein YjbJ (UPF0337 family)
MNEDELKGKAREVTGRAKKAAGDLTGDEELRNQGAEEEIEGEARADVGRARRKVGEAIEDIGKGIKR